MILWGKQKLPAKTFTVSKHKAESHLEESTLAAQAWMSQETFPMLSHLGSLTSWEMQLSQPTIFFILHWQDLMCSSRWQQQRGRRATNSCAFWRHSFLARIYLCKSAHAELKQKAGHIFSSSNSHFSAPSRPTHALWVVVYLTTILVWL